MGGCCNKKRNPRKIKLINPNEDKDAHIQPNQNIGFVDSKGNNFNEDSDYNKINKDDFEVLKLLGKGSFGKVLLVKRKNNDKLYAMKVLNKSYIRQKGQEDHTKTERSLLEKIDSPFVISLYYAFQDDTHLYLVTEFMQGGDLFYHLHRDSYFSIERSKLYICEIILALEDVHRINCIYRDLKPENILLDPDGHIKLTDFGLSKMLLKQKKGKAFTVCGTPDYLAPEIIRDKGYDKTVDWWSLGVLLYEMTTGISPFKANGQTHLDDSHYYKKVPMPNNLSKDLKKLLNKLIEVNPEKRLGYGSKGIENIKNDPFFDDVDWDEVHDKKYVPVFKPRIAHPMDLSNFDRCFTGENVNNVSQEVELPSSVQEHFFGFTYNKKVFEDKNDEEPTLDG